MSKEKINTQNEKRKLSRQEKKQIAAVIKKAKGDGKPHSAQDSIPFELSLIHIWEFAPVKNAEGADSPATALALLLKNGYAVR